MSCSSYAVTSALVVACPTCGAVAREKCYSMAIRGNGKTRKTSHPARRRAADEKRTREVNPEVMKRDIGEDFESYCTECQAVACIHVVEALSNIDPPVLCPDDSQEEVKP